MENYPIDGNTTLLDQQKTLQFIELAKPCKLLTYTKKAGSPNLNVKVNMAVFENIDFDEEIKELILIEVTHENSAIGIISEQLSNGKSIVFHERIFVKGSEKEVLGFR